MPDPAANSPEEAAGFIAGLGAGMGDALRRQLWVAYQGGRTREAGVVDPILVTAAAMRAKGVVIGSAEEFDEFVSAYYAPDRITSIEDFMARKRASQSAEAATAATPPGGSVADEYRPAAAGHAADATRAANPGVPACGGGTPDYGRWRDLNNRKDMGAELSPDERREWFESGQQLGTLPPNTPPPPAAAAPAPAPTTPPPAGPDGLRTALTPPADGTPVRATGLVRGPGPPEDNRPADYDIDRGPPREVDYTPGMRPPGEPERDQSPTAGFDRPQSVVVVGPRPLPVTVENLRDALKKQDREQREPEPGKEQKIGPGLLDVLSGQSAGQSQSGANMAGFLRRMGSIGKRAKERIKGGWSRFRGAGKSRGTGGGTRAPGVGRGGAAAGRAAGGLGRAAAGAGGAAEGAAAGAGAVLGVAGAAVGAVVALGVAAVEATKAVYAFARAQEQEVRRLAEVGGQQAAAVALLDAQRIQRDIRTAGETGGTSKELVESLNKFEDSLQPIEAGITNLANSIGAGLLDAVTELLPLAEAGVDLAIKIHNVLSWTTKIDPYEKKEDQKFAIGLLRDLQQQQEQNGKPMWPTGPPGVGAGR